jgi:hypothetical protein
MTIVDNQSPHERHSCNSVGWMLTTSCDKALGIHYLVRKACHVSHFVWDKNLIWSLGCHMLQGTRLWEAFLQNWCLGRTFWNVCELAITLQMWSSNTLGAHSPESQTITSHIISSLSRVLETLNWIESRPPCIDVNVWFFGRFEIVPSLGKSYLEQCNILWMIIGSCRFMEFKATL